MAAGHQMYLTYRPCYRVRRPSGERIPNMDMHQ